MKIRPLLILLIFVSCHSGNSNNPVVTPAAQLEAHDSGRTEITTPENTLKNNKTVTLKTHLKDTLYADGNFILFLRPDDARYAELNDDPDGGTAEGDSDFGAGITNTEDSVSKTGKYKGIKVLVSANRFISIKDCMHCPLIIDRDPINYGYILSGMGKNIDSSYNSVHSGDYLGEIDNYFFPKK